MGVGVGGEYGGDTDLAKVYHLGTRNASCRTRPPLHRAANNTCWRGRGGSTLVWEGNTAQTRGRSTHAWGS